MGKAWGLRWRWKASPQSSSTQRLCGSALRTEQFPGPHFPDPLPGPGRKAGSPSPCSELGDRVWTLPAVRLLSRVCLRSKPVECDSSRGSADAETCFERLNVTVLPHLSILPERPHPPWCVKTASVLQLAGLGGLGGGLWREGDFAYCFLPLDLSKILNKSWTPLRSKPTRQQLGNLSQKPTLFCHMGRKPVTAHAPLSHLGLHVEKDPKPALLASRCNLCHTPAEWSLTGWTESGSSRRPAAWAWCRWRAWPGWCSGSYWPGTADARFCHLVPFKYRQESHSLHPGSSNLATPRTCTPTAQFPKAETQGRINRPGTGHIRCRWPGSSKFILFVVKTTPAAYDIWHTHHALRP